MIAVGRNNASRRAAGLREMYNRATSRRAAAQRQFSLNIVRIVGLEFVCLFLGLLLDDFDPKPPRGGSCSSCKNHHLRAPDFRTRRHAGHGEDGPISALVLRAAARRIAVTRIASSDTIVL